MGTLGTSQPLLIGILVVGGITALAIIVAEIVRRIALPEALSEHNELAGFIFAVLGVVYAVLLGFIAIGVWERFEQAEIRTFDEAGAFVSIYRNVDPFPEKGAIRKEIRAYTNTVITDEWPAMQHGGASPLADRQVERIADDLRHLTIRTPGEASMQERILAAVDDGLNERDQRLIMDSVGLDGVMWWTLSLGACVTIGFAMLFGFKRTAMRTIMIGALATTIGLVLYLAISLDYPYRGVVSVSSEAFHNALTSYDHIDRYH